MGMTIDDCTKMLIAKEKCMSRETSGIDTDCNSHNCDNCDLCYEQGTMGEQKEALRFAVDTMRKYQKIERIMNYEQTQWGVVKDTWLYKEIREVLEDENVDDN